MAMAPTPDSEQHKRKRDPDDNGGATPLADRIPQPPPPQSGNATPINYLSKGNAGKLRLVHGEDDTISDVLTLINEYEGVLNRHESLAASLGAKLTGPRLVKALEGAFEGEITTVPAQGLLISDPVTWLDIVTFAKTNPDDLTLMQNSTGNRVCQFILKGVQVEITDDDWRMIVSGALDRFRLTPSEPIEEDETAELATLEILEQRLQVCIKKADEVARKARQLKYHMSGRKAAISSRRSAPSQATNSAFQSPNHSGRPSGSSSGYDLKSDLLQQFLSTTSQQPDQHVSSGSLPITPNVQPNASTPRSSVAQPVVGPSSRPSPNHLTPAQKELEEENRSLVTSKIDKIGKGEEINPPCDRCRRLKSQCIKHLTACQGCTKKHAKCSWKHLTEDEILVLKNEPNFPGTGDHDGSERRASSRTDYSGGTAVFEHDDLRPGSDRSADITAGTGNSRPRLGFGTRTENIWRRQQAEGGMRGAIEADLDPNDFSRNGQAPLKGRYSTEGSAREQHTDLRDMATVATAAAFAAASPSPEGSRL